MNKQTAVDRYRLESQKLMIKAIREEISNEEWRLLENKLGEEAKAMEREQIMNAWNSCGESIMTEEFDNAEQYYEQTYGVKGRENKPFMSEEEWVKEYTGEKGRDIE